MKTLIFLSLLVLNSGSYAQSEDKLEKCHNYFEKEQLEKCYNCYDSLIKVHGASEQALRGRGFAALQQGNYQASKDDYRRALIYNDTCANCYTHLASILLMEDSLDAALAYMEQVISLYPKEASYYINRAQINQRKNKKYGISSDYDKAVSLSPTSEYYVVRADYYFSINQYSQASLDYDEAIALSPNDPNFRLARARFYAELEELELATADYKFAVEADSTNPEFLTGFAVVLAISGQNEKAIQYYNRALVYDSSSYQIVFNRGLAYYNSENMAEACKDYRLALTLAADEENLSARERISTSIDELCDTTKMSHYYQHGIAQYNLNDFQEAVQYYDLGIAKFPKSILLHYFRGNALLMLKKYAEASLDYTIALNLPGDVMNELGANPKMQKETMELYSQQLETEMIIALSKSMFFLKNYTASLEYARQALAKVSSVGNQGDGQKSLVNYILALNYGALGNFEKAETVLNTMIEDDPRNPENYIILAQLLYIQTTEDYVEFFHDCANKAEEEGYAIATIAWPSSSKKYSKEVKEKLIKARVVVNRSIDLDGTNAEAYYFRAMIKKCLDEPDICADLQLAEQHAMKDAIKSSAHSCP